MFRRLAGFLIILPVGVLLFVAALAEDLGREVRQWCTGVIDRRRAAMKKPTLEELIERARTLPPMTPEEQEAQRRSFAYGNLRLSGIEVTREDIDLAAEKLDRERGT